MKIIFQGIGSNNRHIRDITRQIFPSDKFDQCNSFRLLVIELGDPILIDSIENLWSTINERGNEVIINSNKWGEM